MEEINNHLSKVSSENNAQKEALDKLKAEHRAICEVAGFQPLPEEAQDAGFIFYLSAKVVDDSVVGITLGKAQVVADNAVYDKDEVLTALKLEMESTFPEYIIETSDHDVTKREDVIHIQEQRVANKVAQQTRRGVANTEFLDFVYYKGSNATDAPFIVYKFGDKYGIFKHPKADQYGFRLIYK